jgi:hypothetical protein
VPGVRTWQAGGPNRGTELLDCVNSGWDSGIVSYNRSCIPARQAQGTVVALVAYSRCLKVVTQALCMLLVGASAVLLLCETVLGWVDERRCAYVVDW